MTEILKVIGLSSVAMISRGAATDAGTVCSDLLGTPHHLLCAQIEF